MIAAKKGTSPLCRLTARIVICAVLALISTEVGITHAQVPTKTVLVLFDEHTELPGLSALSKSISSTLNADPSFKIDVYAESMNLSRFQRDGYEEFLRDYYKEKYKNKKIDAVIAALGPSLNFALAHMQEIAPNVPIIFCGVDEYDLEGKTLGENVTGVLVKRDFTGTLEAALRMQPDTRQVIFVGGSSDFDQQLTARAAQQLKAYEDRVAISYLTGQPLDNVLKTVSQLPPYTVILYSTLFKDGAGESFVTHEVATLISTTASAPVYGFVDQYLGRGIVGGHLYSVEAHGTKAAEQVLRILHGESAKNIPVVEGSSSFDMFDARQLKRWNIDERNLPLGSVIQFREPTLWEDYKWYILGMTLLLAAESLLIGFLIYLRHRQRQAEEQNTHLHNRLKEIVSNVPGIVWESRTDPAISGRRTTFISDYVERMLGYTPEEWLRQQPGFGLKVIQQEDRDRVQGESDKVIETGDEAVSEYRWLTKDGRLLWVENHIAPIVDEKNHVVGLRGVALDVTDRKAAEEKVRQTEERNTAIVTAIPDMLFLVSPKGVCIDYHVNDPEELLIPPEEFLGKHLTDLLPPELAEEFLEGFERASAEPGPQIIEYKLALGGAEKWFESRIVRTGSNFLNVVRDITERRATEKALQQSENRLRMAQQAARVGTWEWDIATGVSVWSEMIWELLGLESNDGDTTVKRFVEFIHPEDRERVFRKVTAVLADGEEYYDEFRVVRTDGRTLWLASKGALIRSGDGEPERMLGVNIDITELKNTQLEAQEISGRLISAHEDERARLARELHDDACQNLALLAIELELLEQIPTTEGECIRSKLKVLSERVSELSTELRRMSHQLHPARLAHLGLASAVRGFCKEIEAAHDLKIEFVEANTPPTLPESTSLNIYRIIQESLQNVVKHSGASEASVILSANGNSLQLTISDNGRGFDAKIAAPAESLGLISLRERIRLLHGTISIDSRPDSGTRIEATVPIQ